MGGMSVMDIKDIMKILPHRYPMLLIDRIIELEPGKRAVSLKNVSINEPQFMGHYPQNPILPGVYILEIMAQTCGVAFLSELKNPEGIPLFAGVDNARFRKTVVPGDQLIVDVRISQKRGNIAKVVGTATVDNEVVAEAQLLFALGK